MAEHLAIVVTIESRDVGNEFRRSGLVKRWQRKGWVGSLVRHGKLSAFLRRVWRALSAKSWDLDQTGSAQRVEVGSGGNVEDGR